MLGGTLLIGAEEDGNGKVEKYLPVTSDEITKWKSKIATSVEKRCRPIPLIDFYEVSYESGYLLAVNIWPSMAAPIGVRVKADKESSGFGGDSYVFPIRLANQTTFISSENLAMHMLPELRRKLILLYSIPAGEEVLYCPISGGSSKGTIEVDESANIVRFQISENDTRCASIDSVVNIYRVDKGPPFWRILTKWD